MKRIVLVGFVSFLVLATKAQSARFIITGDLSAVKAPADWVYLSYYLADRQVKDSSPVRGNKYVFEGKISEPVLARLSVKYKAGNMGTAPVPVNSKRDYASVFLQPSIIKVVSVDSFSNVRVSGSAADDEYRRLEAMAAPYNQQLDELYARFSEARKSKNDALAASLEANIDSLDAAANEAIYGKYVKEHPNSPLAMYAFKNWAGYEIDAAKVEPVFASLPAAVQKSASGKDMMEKIAIARKTGIGQLALDFTQADTLGNPVTLSSLRGNYLLIDFWASWCGPCRRENPHLVKAFHKYNGKGFRVLGVSLDRPGDKEKWLQAIRTDGLAWTQVSDLQFWNNAVARQYGIQAIPQNLLLDPSGKIIAKNLRGAALEKKLAMIYPD
ncbi:MAG TPA: TlpA disulfide reductase family protein [Chitinophagaceae bacterium]|nr:TlpA disulfide reductase family protein [Chitinophagaceae bacterium]